MLIITADIITMSTQAQTQELLDSVSPTCQNEPKPLLRQSQTAESPSKDDLSHTIVDETWPDSSQNDVGPQKLNAQEIQYVAVYGDTQPQSCPGMSLVPYVNIWQAVTTTNSQAGCT